MSIPGDYSRKPPIAGILVCLMWCIQFTNKKEILYNHLQRDENKKEK